MINEIEKLALAHNDRLKVISIEHLAELKAILEDFGKEETLNNFQNWIINKLYKFEMPEETFKINSIILVAVHHPFYAKVNFIKDGQSKTFFSLVRADFDKVEDYLTKFAAEKGYSIKLAKNLPFKRLATHSGLAKYGRNNITYIDGLGSNFSYIAYFTDMLCEEDTWGEMQNTDFCNKCELCLKECPTKAILKDKFLIDSQKCLSCINEMPGDFPAWIPKTAHHTLYDCLICQRVCPMNREQLNNVMEDICFTEEETNMLLEGKPIDTFSEEFKAKVYMLGINEWYKAIPRNLKTLFEI